MRRREFLKLTAGAAAAGIYDKSKLAQAAAVLNSSAASVFHVSLSGSDANPGTEKLPFATLYAAQQAVRAKERAKDGSAPVTVLVHEGTYYSETPLRLNSKDSRTIYAAVPGQSVTISGGKRLSCDWKPYKDGILIAEVAP